MMNRMLFFGLPLVMLAACSGGKDAASGEAKEQPAAASSGPMTVAEAAKQVDKIQLTPGQWEGEVQIVSMEMGGSKMPPGAMEAMKGHVTKISHCLTPEEAAKPGAEMFSGDEANKCSYQNFDMAGGKINATMICPGEKGSGKMMMTMAGDYGPSSYAMDVVIKSEAGADGQSMTMHSRSSSKRVGACA